MRKNIAEIDHISLSGITRAGSMGMISAANTAPQMMHKGILF